MMPFWIGMAYISPDIGGILGLLGLLLFGFLFIASAFFIYACHQLMKFSLLVSIEANGIILRHYGFISWNKIEKIGYDKIGLVFQFSLLERTSDMPSECWRPNLHTIRYQGNRVLAFFRTEGFGLNAEGKNVDWRDVLLSLECYYGLWLDPTLKQEKDGLPQLDGKKLTETIRAKKDGIKFGEKYKDMVAAFNATRS